MYRLHQSGEIKQVVILVLIGAYTCGPIIIPMLESYIELSGRDRFQLFIGLDPGEFFPADRKVIAETVERSRIADSF